MEEKEYALLIDDTMCFNKVEVPRNDPEIEFARQKAREMIEKMKKEAGID